MSAPSPSIADRIGARVLAEVDAAETGEDQIASTAGRQLADVLGSLTEEASATRRIETFLQPIRALLEISTAESLDALMDSDTMAAIDTQASSVRTAAIASVSRFVESADSTVGIDTDRLRRLLSVPGNDEVWTPTLASSQLTRRPLHRS